MTPLSSLSSIAHESQQGVAAMAQGDYQGALRVSFQALRKIGAILRQPHDETEADAEMADAAACPSIVRSLPLEDLPASAGAVSMFQSALVFDSASPPSRLEEEQSQAATLAAVLCYNSGLCYHLLGLQTVGRQSEGFLQRALQMYTTASSLLSETNDQGLTMKDDHVLIALALLNNMAHIHSAHTMNVDRMHECLEAMEDISEAFGGCLLGEDRSPDFLFFSIACIVISRNSLVASPAA